MTPLAVGAYRTLAAGKHAGALLCTQLDGRSPLTQTQYWFDPCVKKAGLVDFHFHDLRHTAASRWVMNGVPLAAVAGFLGHRNIQMTMRYSHLQPGNHERAIAAMMSIYEEKTDTSTSTTDAQVSTRLHGITSKQN
jgi:integrase